MLRDPYWRCALVGHKVLPGLSPGTKEDTACGREFLRDLKSRRPADPILAITDGAPGLIRAAEEMFPPSLRQRCLAHKIRNLEAKVPAELWWEVNARPLAAYQAPRPMLAELAREEFVKRFERELPTATSCFQDDFAACITHLRLPIAHRRVIRTTNLLERLFGEERRRTKVIQPAFGERAVVKLMYAALIRASQTSRRVVIDEFEQRQIEEIRSEINEEFKHRMAPAVFSASHHKIYSKIKTRPSISRKSAHVL